MWASSSRWLVAAALVVLPACGGGSGETPTAPGGGANTITMTAASRFSPADITIDAGTTIHWNSATSELHTITPDNPQQPGVWVRTVTASVGNVLTHTFSVPGQTYTYHCETHLDIGMTGTIRVR